MKRYPFGRFILDVPDAHAVSEIHKTAALYDRAFGFILEELSRRTPDGVMIDIGGNVGDSAAFFATCVSNPIVSVEGNPDYLGYFRANQGQFGGQVSLVDKFITTDALKRLNLKFDARPGDGQLRITQGNGVPDDQFISVAELFRIATRGRKEVCLLKTDTDGMDGFILSDVLEQVRIPLFFECDTNTIVDGAGTPWPSVFRRLTDEKYSVIVFDNFGLPVAATDKDPGALLTDLSGYTHLQRTVHPVRIYYFDVWAFPPEWKQSYEACTSVLRNGLLKPYLFPAV